MLKKLILLIMASVLFITGCQAVKGVDLNKLVLSSSKINSAESKTTASLDLKYAKSKVKDKDFLKVLTLLDNAKLEVYTKMQDANTVSITGNIILHNKGKIPLRLYMDKKYTVIQLDNAKKPVRVPMDNGTSPDQKLIKDVQTKLMAPVVRNLPNPFPAHLKVTANTTDKVHGVKVKGHRVQAKVYANEVPKLLESFLDNLSKDEKAIADIVNALNEINKVAGDDTKMTVENLKAGIEEFKQMLPELKTDPEFKALLTSKNNVKTDIFLDKHYYERKSYTTLNIGSIPDGEGLTGVTLKIKNETWNINKKVKASKIKKYSKYLNENATPEQFLATLDKKKSVLYSAMTSLMYSPSKVLKKSQVKVTNNKGKKADKITVKSLKKGEVIKVYSKTGSLIAAKESTGKTAVLTVKQLGKKSGKVYVSIIRSKHAESGKVSITFKAEKK
ncbi:hypothetical protein IEC97_02675 [Neobacillus cucumis]|uniref:hypothetical protein n=1 Tax=Neobacillus cucumis TaxID=1740721 RepID=UPI0018DFD8AD|nr:hypothetical protein [Neobacillus cucumis]MBI0576254.1 hypothetical protein [Neobacillus cucumis]